MASCRVLNCGHCGTKSKVIGQVDEELWHHVEYLTVVIVVQKVR